MKKRIICACLAVTVLLGLIFAAAPASRAASSMCASEAFISLLKQLEGFSEKPYWDVSQYTVGYGCRCPDEDLERYLRDGITQEEADALLRKTLPRFETALNKFIDKYDLNLAQQQFDALFSLSFNCGTRWTNSSMLKDAVISGTDRNTFLYIMSTWSTADGQTLRGLVKRRLIEANIYLNGTYSTQPPANFCYVLYNAVGGVSTERVQGYDAELTAVPIASATYSGYQFVGWYTKATGGEQITTLDASTSGITLYAHWEPISGNGTQPSPNVEPGDPIDTVQVTVTGSRVNLRTGPDTSYSLVATVSRGQTLSITRVCNTGGVLWGKSDRGWICLQYTDYGSTRPKPTEPQPTQPTQPQPTQPLPTEPQPTQPAPTEPAPTEPTLPVITGTPQEAVTVKVTARAVNVRSGPSMAYPVIGSVSMGQTYTITHTYQSDGMLWGKCTRGWICLLYTNYAQVTAPAPEVGTQQGSASVPTPALVPVPLGDGTIGIHRNANSFYLNGAAKGAFYETRVVIEMGELRISARRCCLSTWLPYREKRIPIGLTFTMMLSSGTT